MAISSEDPLSLAGFPPLTQPNVAAAWMKIEFADCDTINNTIDALLGHTAKSIWRDGKVPQHDP